MKWLNCYIAQLLLDKKTKPIYLIFWFLFMFFTACQNCDDVNEHRAISEIKVLTPDSILKPINNQINILFYVEDKFTSRKGDRKCRQKDYVIGQDNFWLEDRFALKCTEDLIYDNDTFKANSDLLNSTIVHGKIKLKYSEYIDPYESKLRFFNVNSKSIVNKSIKFYISGTTNRNENLMDSCQIKIIP